MSEFLDAELKAQAKKGRVSVDRKLVDRNRPSTNFSRIFYLLAMLTCAAFLLNSCGKARAQVQYKGVNLASGEFASNKLPGRYGYDYVYPDKKTASPFSDAGMNTVRLPFRWERIQSKPFGELSSVEMERLDSSINDLSEFSTIILDLHNYARYNGEVLDVDNGGDMLADLWTRLAKRYAGNPKIAFGLMNEPFTIDAKSWRTIVDQVIGAIRETGASNLVLVPGTRWTGGHSWTHGGAKANSVAFAGFTDPGDNFLFEIHQYLDANSSGTSTDCVSPSVIRSRLSELTHWLREEGQRALLAEFGAADNAACLSALTAILDYMEENDDAWSGWTYWAGGAWWGDYPMSVQPKEGGEVRLQMKILAQYL